MALLFGHDQVVAEWVGRASGNEFPVGCVAFGTINDEGRLVGGVVFSNYTGHAIALTLAGASCLRRGFLMAIVDYVFRQIRCDRLECRIQKSDRRLRSVLPRLGLKYEGTARRFYGHEHGLIFSLTRDDLPAFFAKWGRHGQKERQRAA